MSTNRIYYAIQKASVMGVSSLVQSVAMNTSVDFEQVFELGTLGQIEDIEGIPTAEITVERALPVTGTSMWGAISAGKGGTSATQYIANLTGIPAFVDVVPDDATAGAGQRKVNISGYLTNYSQSYQVEGPATESVTIAAETISWNGAGGGVPGANSLPTPSTVVLSRKNILSGDCVQSAGFGVDMSREDILCLGKKLPTYRAATFPIECSADTEKIVTSTDAGHAFTPTSEEDITTSHSVIYGIGTLSNARFTSSAFSGGDAGGGNQTVTYSYIAYNSFDTSR